MAASKRSACFYQNGRVFTQQNKLSTRTIFQHPTGLLAQLNAGTEAGRSLIAGDTSNTVTTLCGPEDSEQRRYTAYGQYLARNESYNPMAFNGEPLDLATGCYLLGNGYRLFNPTLMRFISPDSLSPFERGGVNAYAYCAGDPVNKIDPSGQVAFWVVPTLVAGVVTAAAAYGATRAQSKTTKAILIGIAIVAGFATLFLGGKIFTSRSISYPSTSRRLDLSRIDSTGSNNNNLPNARRNASSLARSDYPSSGHTPRPSNELNDLSSSRASASSSKTANLNDRHPPYPGTDSAPQTNIETEVVNIRK